MSIRQYTLIEINVKMTRVQYSIKSLNENIFRLI